MPWRRIRSAESPETGDELVEGGGVKVSLIEFAGRTVQVNEVPELKHRYPVGTAQQQGNQDRRRQTVDECPPNGTLPPNANGEKKKRREE